MIKITDVFLIITFALALSVPAVFAQDACEGNFDCDEDVDGLDAGLFKIDFGRSFSNNPCMSEPNCSGDFDCDGDCDGTDAAKFKDDFGRSNFNNPCPVCEMSFQTSCLGQEQPDGLSNIEQTMWEYTCFSTIEGHFAHLFDWILNQKIGFYQGEAYRVELVNENDCRLNQNYTSEIIYKQYGFLPLVFFEFGERYYTRPFGFSVTYYWKGFVLPNFNIGFLEVWMDPSSISKFDEVLNCYMIKTSHKLEDDSCTICYGEECYY